MGRKLGYITILFRMLVSGIIFAILIIAVVLGDRVQLGIFMFFDGVFWSLYFTVMGIMFVANLIAFALVPDWGKGSDY